MFAIYLFIFRFVFCCCWLCDSINNNYLFRSDVRFFYTHYGLSSDRIPRFWVLHNDMLLILNDTMVTKRFEKQLTKNHISFTTIMFGCWFFSSSCCYYNLDGRFENDEVWVFNFWFADAVLIDRKDRKKWVRPCVHDWWVVCDQKF